MGEIHVDSALNEPLAAEIDIVGATPDELAGLIATVANRETFSHFGAERPSFLNTTTFKVTKDAQGKPVLAIRSSDSFTEPLIDFVVDLRWRNGQLIRQYSLLLDPAGFPTAIQAATPLPVPPTQSALTAPVVTARSVASNRATYAPTTRHRRASSAAAPGPTAVLASDAASSSATSAVSTRTMTEIKVGPKATLRGIAWRIGARSGGDLNQMMIALFRANPSAFDGNINRLRLGATLKIPSADEIAAISHSDANRETHAHMQAWRDGVKLPGSNVSVARTTTPAANPAAGVPAHVAPAAAPLANTAPVNVAPVAPVTPAKAPAASAAPSSVAPASAPAAAVNAPAAVAVAPAAVAPAAADAAASPATPAAGEKAVLTAKIVSLEGSLQDIQAQLEAQHNKLLTMQAQVRYAEQHPTTAAAPAAVPSSNRGLLAAAIAGIAVLAGVCATLFMRLRRRAKTSSLPSIEKVPVVAPVEVVAPPAPVARPKPVPVTVRAPEPPQIVVHEHEEPREQRVEPRIAMAEMQPEEQQEPMESALELSAADTSGINAAKLREELAAAKLREEIAAAWALPAAESYKREDALHHESTLAQDIAKSLEDTIRLQGAEAASADATIEEEAYTDTIANSDETIVGSAETANFAATEVLPDSTMKMSPGDFPQELDPEHLDYNFVELDDADAKGDARNTSATDKIKMTGEIKAASEGLKLGADDPGLSLHDELTEWAKKSA